MWYLIMTAAGVVVGWVACFFVIRNNPKYLKIDDILKGKRDDILRLVRARAEIRLQDLAKQAHGTVDTVAMEAHEIVDGITDVGGSPADSKGV